MNYILFTDGSVRRLRTGECISGYGIVVVDTTTKQYTCFGGDIRTTSIVYAEAWAIYRGLHFISKITKTRNVKPHVLVVSDSKLNVSILGDLIPNTWDLSDWDNWKKKDGSPVMNQELYRDIVELISGDTPTLSGFQIVRGGDGMPLERRKGFKYLHLASLFKNKLAEPFMVTAKYSEAEQKRPIPRSTHNDQEFDLILEGKLKFVIDNYYSFVSSMPYADNGVITKSSVRDYLRTEASAVILSRIAALAASCDMIEAQTKMLACAE